MVNKLNNSFYSRISESVEMDLDSTFKPPRNAFTAMASPHRVTSPKFISHPQSKQVEKIRAANSMLEESIIAANKKITERRKLVEQDNHDTANKNWALHREMLTCLKQDKTALIQLVKQIEK